MDQATAREEVFTKIAGDPEGALILAKENAEEHANSTEALLILADLYFVGLGPGRESARPLYEKVLDLDPSNPTALTGLALMPGLDVEESIQLLERVTTIVEKPLTLLNLGYKQWEYARYSMAIETFKKVLYLAQEERNRDLSSSVEEAIKRIRNRQPPISYSYVLP